jgi:flagellar protein FlaG
MDQLSLNVNVLNVANGNNVYNADKVNGSAVNSKNNTANQNNDNVANNKNISANQTKSENSSAEKEKELNKQIESNLNPAPMLSKAMLFKWDASAGGAVIKVVDFKTGKVLAQIPPNSVLKMMSNYQKGSLYSSKL